LVEIIDQVSPSALQLANGFTLGRDRLCQVVDFRL
jgi:hypothetical protein